MTPFLAVLRVVNVAPQVQLTWVGPYAGWMSFFTAVSFVDVGPGRRVTAVECGCATRDAVNRTKAQVCQRH